MSKSKDTEKVKASVSLPPVYVDGSRSVIGAWSSVCPIASDRSQPKGKTVGFSSQLRGRLTHLLPGRGRWQEKDLLL